jgi:hypothetical protein
MEITKQRRPFKAGAAVLAIATAAGLVPASALASRTTSSVITVSTQIQAACSIAGQVDLRSHGRGTLRLRDRALWSGESALHQAPLLVVSCWGADDPAITVDTAVQNMTLQRSEAAKPEIYLTTSGPQRALSFAAQNVEVTRIYRLVNQGPDSSSRIGDAVRVSIAW